jgi:hypothetical protein
MGDKMPEKSNVDIVGTYNPSKSDVKKHVNGRAPKSYEKLD